MFSWLRAVWEWFGRLFGKRPGPVRTVEDYAPPRVYSVVDRAPDGTELSRRSFPEVRLAKRLYYKPVPPGAIREFHDGSTVRGVRHADE